MFVIVFGKVTEVSKLLLNALVPIVVTELGIEIDVSRLESKALLPMDVRPVPKLSDEITLCLKAPTPIICREFGRVSELI